MQFIIIAKRTKNICGHWLSGQLAHHRNLGVDLSLQSKRDYLSSRAHQTSSNFFVLALNTSSFYSEDPALFPNHEYS